MRREQHEAETLRLLGAKYTEVHAWLDEFAFKDGKFDPTHRQHRHHAEGVAQVRAMWGDAAALAAVAHIRQDMRHGGVPDHVPIPENRMKALTILG